MITRGIDATGRWLFGKGRNDYKRNKDAIEQNIKTRLQSFVGDCFFALDKGIDWFNLLGTNNKNGLRLEVSACILGTEGVTGIVEMSVNMNPDRTITIQYNVDTIYGNVDSEITQGV